MSGTETFGISDEDTVRWGFQRICLHILIGLASLRLQPISACSATRLRQHFSCSITFSDTARLQRCREEMELITSVQKPSSGTAVRCIELSKLKTHCLYLLAVFQEVLRLRGSPTVRRVMRDTMVRDYALKKGATVYVPSGVFQTDPEYFGPDADAFRPERWLEGKRVDPNAMRPFGGGNTLCPGRNFATTEVLAAAAMMVMRYHLTPVAGGWKAPTTNNSNIASVIAQPDRDIEAELRERDEFSGSEWIYELQDSSNQAFSSAVEDKVVKVEKS